MKKTALNQKSILKAKKSLNVKSKKQLEIDSEYKKVREDNFKEKTLCTGCGRTSNSTPSHLVPRSRRRDLITEKRNIKPHCVKCHLMWESLDRVKLLDYKENLEIVKELDFEYYEILKRDEESLS